MRAILSLSLFVMLLGLSGPAFASPTDEDRAAFKRIINGQLAAFREVDDEKAFAFVSPSLKYRFPTATKFVEMVRLRYAPVYLPQSVKFGAVTKENGRLVQKVSVIGPRGREWLASYGFVRHPNGSWRIANVDVHPLKPKRDDKQAVEEGGGATLVAELAPQRGGAKFKVAFDTATKKLRIQQVGGQKPADKDFELWMIEKDKAPVSLGVITGGGSTTAAVEAKLQSAFAEGLTLAVSVEPIGGSTTGAPTGPVVALGPLKKT